MRSISRWRRDMLAYAICAALAVGAAVLGAWAAVLALDPLVGVVYSRLIVGGAFAACALAIAIVVRLGRQSSPSPLLGSASRATVPGNAQLTQVAMIVEAVLLGYALSRRFGRR